MSDSHYKTNTYWGTSIHTSQSRLEVIHFELSTKKKKKKKRVSKCGDENIRTWVNASFE